MSMHIGFVKQAWKWNKPGFLDKAIRRFDSHNDMVSALMRSPGMRESIRKYLRWTPRRRNRLGKLKLLARQYREMSSSAEAAIGAAGGIRGAVYDTPKGVRVALKRVTPEQAAKAMKLAPGATISRRNIIGHESFHARTMDKGKAPLGNSEILAHAAGAAAVGGSKDELRRTIRMFIGGNPGRLEQELRGVSNAPSRERVLKELPKIMAGTGNERLAKRYVRRAYRTFGNT